MKTKIDRGEIRRITVVFDETDIKKALLAMLTNTKPDWVLAGAKMHWEMDHPFWDDDKFDLIGEYTATLVQNVETLMGESQP